MTDHLEQAAAEAQKLVDDLSMHAAVSEAAALHLQYLAGLIRGGAVRPSRITLGEGIRFDSPVEPTTYSPANSGERRSGGPDEPIRFYPSNGTTMYPHVNPAGSYHAPIETDAEPSQGELDELREKLKAAEILRDVQESAATQYRKRWHEAATQRDALARAARELLASDLYHEAEHLRAVVEQVESGSGPTIVVAGFEKSNALRRELWAVLDRMPASDDDLIASVRALKAERDEAIRQHEKTVDVMERARAQRDELLAAIETFIDAPAEWGPRADLANVANRILADKA